jgi:hypothetical protein
VVAASFQCRMRWDCIVCSGRVVDVVELLEVAVEFDRCFGLVEREGVDVNGQCKLKMLKKHVKI